MRISKIKHLLTLTLLSIMSMAFASCAPVDTEATLRQAEADMQSGDIEKAASGCDFLTDSTQTALTPSQLCRVAIIYAKISEKSEKEDYMASAAKCFKSAADLNADSIDSFIQSLTVEDLNYVRLINELTRAINTPIDISRENDDDEEGESYPVDSFGIDTVNPNALNHKSTASL